MIALLFLFAISLASPEAAVLEGMVAEIERVPDLRLPDRDPAYHALSRALSGWTLKVRARFGALQWSWLNTMNGLQVEVRAGSPEFDSASLRSRRGASGFGTHGIPDVPTVRGVREILWRELDTQYKGAVENLGRAEGAREQLETDDDPETVWQLATSPVVDVRTTDVARPDPVPLETLARALSDVVRGRDLHDAHVSIEEQLGHATIVDTDGTRVQYPVQSVHVRMRVQVRATDGELRWFDEHEWLTARDELPDLVALAERYTALADRALIWASADRLEEPWYGPVLVRGRAAAELVQEIVVNRLKGTPATATWQPWNQEVDVSDDGFVRPGSRLLPRGWAVVDDATRALGEPCCPEVDAEGIRPQAVTLVDDGEVVQHLMTRTPNRWFGRSTGHARPSRSERCKAGESWITVASPGRGLSARELWRRARKQARQQGVDRVLVISHDRTHGVWRTLEGEETPVRGIQSPEMDARALRSMTVAGPTQTSVVGGGLRYTVPALLLQSVAVEPSPPEPEPEPRRRSPLLDAS